MKIVKILFFGYFCILHAVNNTDVDNNWTWVLSKKYTQNERAANTQKKELFFKKENTPLFTQLLFSWNIVRPQKGYFSFYARVRDAETKKWGAWHLMADWGANIQKTYVKKSDGLSSFMHVRLELNHNKKADAFCIKIESHDGVCASFVDGISVALSNFAMFKAEQNDLTTLKTVIVSGVPTIAQFTIAHKDKGRICSPVSCAMLTQYLTGNTIDMHSFMAAIFDEGLSVYGSWQCNVAHVFNI